MGWSEVAGGYQVTLRDGEVVARNAKGRELRSLPTSLRDDPAVVGLRQLTEWLARHEAQCRTDIERWMVRSLPVPVAVLTEVWPDEAWRNALTDLVVAVLDDDGGWDPDEVGLLREAGDGQIGLVDLDGDTVRRAARRVVVPHPVALTDLDDLREFAADLQVRQSVDQLFRQTWVRGADVDPKAFRFSEYSGGRYGQLSHLTARATKLGYPVRGGNAVCRVFENGRTVEARSWVGADDPYYETETGDLVFTDRHGTALPLGTVGPVAWSEGTRMAAALYAGRIVAQEQEEEQ
ncbi:hypothetical protein C5N14_08665 [Micromonospora sp. MW-13]|uniref:DUF4132 domain-containing protein n=1 Tax=unclassified Micromonospora TaxID=2617518 RepID=UPI000E450D20|nr:MULTISPECIES: DUF4132 domain-containing protein [unclassified Micromonospora]MCX4472642.1 DUF4132 domain-containing protein [Micromonospora sp. NBC_01655]RGC69332.1 hypothetical protein C5N14_08665 [Micromonospora sp. MW-13]